MFWASPFFGLFLLPCFELMQTFFICSKTEISCFLLWWNVIHTYAGEKRSHPSTSLVYLGKWAWFIVIVSAFLVILFFVVQKPYTCYPDNILHRLTFISPVTLPMQKGSCLSGNYRFGYGNKSSNDCVYVWRKCLPTVRSRGENKVLMSTQFCPFGRQIYEGEAHAGEGEHRH